MPRLFLLALVTFVCAVDPAQASPAQLQLGTIEGQVLDPAGIPVDGAVVALVDSGGTAILSVSTQAGRFRLPNVTPGTYSLRADAPPLQAVLRGLTVRGAHTVSVELRLAAAAGEQVHVHADRDVGTAAVGVTLAGSAVRGAPVRLRSRALQSAIAATPGWSTEDNGLVHVRGVDDGFLYVIDGVPVYERLDGLFGVSPDPAMVESVNVLTGYIPAEFGFKAGGVIEVRSAGGPAESWQASLDAGAGSHATREFSGLAGGPVGRSTALTMGLTGEMSHRFLDPVHPDNLHNDGGTVSGGGQLGWRPSASAVVTTLAGFGVSSFDVPHGEEQEEAGQDQRQRIRNYWQTATWQHIWSPESISQLAAYYRRGSAALDPSPHDTPLSTRADRSVARAGVLATFTRHAGRHLIKAGGEASRIRLREAFSFAVVDEDDAEEADLSDAAREFTLDRPFLFRESATASLFSAYLQDSIRVSGRLSLDLGVRADWSRLLLPTSQVSPRIGASYYLSPTRTTIRASVSGFFQPPQAENLLLASSEAVRALSPFTVGDAEGGAALEPERQTAIDMSVSQPFGRHLRGDLSLWRRRMRNVADPNVFFGTTIIFPNSVARGRASGFDARLELLQLRRWSAHLSYTYARVTQFGPINGGLFLEDDVIEIGEGTAFTPDHDQRHVGGFGVTYANIDRGLSATLNGRYESGTPLEVGDEAVAELQERPGAALVDFARGRVRPRTVADFAVTQRIHTGRRVDVSLRAAALNLTGERWAYNFGNPFSGTHFGPGRTFKIAVATMLRWTRKGSR